MGPRRGHISGAKNVPYLELVDQETGCLKDSKELEAILIDKNIKPD
jgi:3-mercaptopyruvate sulfurtransferase SseA